MVSIMAYDWDIIKTEYIQGFVDKNGNLKLPTLKELSQRHACSYSRTKQKSASGNWIHQRKLFGEIREEKIHEKKLAVLVSEATQFASKSLKAATMGIDEGLERLEDKNLSTHDYMKISMAISNYQKIGLLALGEPTERVKNDNKHDMIGDPMNVLNDPEYITEKRKMMDDYYDKRRKK